MIVLQDKDAGLGELRKLVDESRKHTLQREAARCLQLCKSTLTDISMKFLAGGNDIAPETNGIVITLVERHPGSGRRVLSLAKRCEPLADKCGFAEAGGCGYQREFVVKPFVESCQQEITTVSASSSRSGRSAVSASSQRSGPRSTSSAVSALGEPANAATKGNGAPSAPSWV